MRYSAVFTQVKIPIVIFGFHAQFFYTIYEYVVALFPLTAADEFAYTRYKQIRRRDGLSVVVKAHIKRFDFFRIIG